MSNCGHVIVLTAIWSMLSGSPHDIYATYGPYSYTAPLWRLCGVLKAEIDRANGVSC